MSLSVSIFNPSHDTTTAGDEDVFALAQFKKRLNRQSLRPAPAPTTTTPRRPRPASMYGMLPSTPPSFCTSLPVLQPIPKAIEHIAISMHPDFTQGDLVVICPSLDGVDQIGFRANSALLRSTCEMFTTIGDPDHPLEIDGRLYLEDPAPDMNAFLRYLTRTTEGHELDLTIKECFAINSLINRYGGKPFVRYPLAAFVASQAVNLVPNLGKNPPRLHLLRLLALAADTRAADVWHWVIAHLRCGWWRDALDPSKLDEDDVQVLGMPAFNALRFLALFASAETWTEIDVCAVGRDPNGLFFLIRSSPSGQQIYSDTSL